MASWFLPTFCPDPRLFKVKDHHKVGRSMLLCLSSRKILYRAAVLTFLAVANTDMETGE